MLLCLMLHDFPFMLFFLLIRLTFSHFLLASYALSSCRFFHSSTLRSFMLLGLDCFFVDALFF
ncbi:hypothetical protein BDZ91DRAFT_514580 [Kalaharituber pfeilii]|nr:hypothetical protein BDZ91DRAFT_514580 [Kalaharituber pfeilii]